MVHLAPFPHCVDALRCSSMLTPKTVADFPLVIIELIRQVLRLRCFDQLEVAVLQGWVILAENFR